MSELSNRIVQKLWSYCNVLRDDGLSYQAYLEQLTYILFLKMAGERAAPEDLRDALGQIESVLADLRTRVR